EDGRARIGIVKNDENTLGRNWLQSKLSNTNERLGEAYGSEPSDRVLEKIADDIILYYSANGTSLSPTPHDVTLGLCQKSLPNGRRKSEDLASFGVYF
uniref:hypothetical protein n=1 Tax=Bacteroides sp. TaxID=29523 RepID=UPI003AAE4DA7